MKSQSFVKRTWALALFLVFALVITACGDPETTGEEGSDTTAGATSDVPRPDLMVVTWDDAIGTLDPAAVPATDVARGIIMQTYERLLEVPADSSQGLIPALATEIPSTENGGISEDGLTYTFNIREGVKFHDGTDLTAEDVKYSWERVINMALPEGQSELFEGIAEINAVDDYTLEVVLDEIRSEFLLSPVAAMPASIVSQDAVEANGGVVEGQPNEYMAQNPVGTGPYAFSEWNRGVSIEFDIFEDYWGEPAHLPVRGLNIKEAAAGAAAGEYDVIAMVPTDVAKLEGIDNVVINTDNGSLQLLEIGFNMNIDTSVQPDGDTIPADFFQDVRIRQAFNYAFPYEDYVEGVLEGLGGRGRFMLPEGIVGFDPDAPIYQRDPEMAEQLLTEAGVWEEGFTVSIATDQSHDGFTGAALAMKDGMESLGNPNIHINVLGVAEARFDEILATQPLPVGMWSYTSPELRGPLEYFLNAAHPDGPWGSIASFADGYTDPERIVSLIGEAQVEVDADARNEIYSELQQVLYEEAPWVMPAQEVQPYAYADWMQDVAMNPMWPRPYMKWSLYHK